MRKPFSAGTPFRGTRRVFAGRGGLEEGTLRREDFQNAPGFRQSGEEEVQGLRFQAGVYREVQGGFGLGPHEGNWSRVT